MVPLHDFYFSQMPVIFLVISSYLSLNCWVINEASSQQVDKAADPEKIKLEAKRKDIICISALTGEGLNDFCDAVQNKLKVHNRLISQCSKEEKYF